MSFTAATTRPALSMKLLIDTKAQRVLFAEVNKDVVDFLFSLLVLPIATAVRLLGSGSMVGSVGNLHSSVVKIDGAYVLSEDDLYALLHPTVSSQAAASNISLLRQPDPSPKGFFRCDNCESPRYMTDERGTKCLECRTPMMVEMRCVRPDSGGSREAASVGTRGFVQGIVTYTVTDNLKVTPMSSISSMTLLISHGVMDFSALQEKTVRLGSTAVSIRRTPLYPLQ
jgi:hypothetical protein